MIKTIMAAAFLIFSALSFASHGQTFEIKEDSMLRALSNDVDQKEGQEKHLEEITHYINAPSPVLDINETKEYKSFYYDPIYQVKEEITGLNGEVIAQKGQIINPMDKIDTLQDLIFFDGTNLKHIKWAQTQPKAKWILIKGSPLDIEEETDHETYFDQMGMLCKKFGIKRVPTKISKEGKRILIEEIPCLD